MKDEKGASRDLRRLETRFAQLQSQLEGVAAENRDLRDQIAVLTEHLGAVKRGETETALPLELSPPAPPESLPRRAIRKALRLAAGAVRTLRRATDPGADAVRTLVAVAGGGSSSAPTEGNDENEPVVVGTVGIDRSPIDTEELRLLFALEGIDAATVRMPGTDASITVVRPALETFFRTADDAAPARAAAALHRPVIVKTLPAPRPGERRQWLLRPVRLAGGETLWCWGPYVVGLPKGVRKAELRLDTNGVPGVDCPPAEIVVLVSGSLAEGFERRLAAGIDAVGAEKCVIVSLASWEGEDRDRRLRALVPDGRVLFLGSVLHRALWAGAFRGVVRSARPETLWVVGDEKLSEDPVRAAREEVPGIRVVWEAIGRGALSVEADAVVVPSEEHRATLEGTPGMTGLQVIPTPLNPIEPRAGGDVRRTLGVPSDASLVVVSGDLVPSGRPEDAAAVARRLADREDIWFRVVGRGPLAEAVGDLGRLFGLGRFAVVDPGASLEEIVDAADVVCCPGAGDILPPAAAAALATGTAVAAPGDGEAADLAAAGTAGLHVGGAPGDIEALARAVLDAIDEPNPGSGPDDRAIEDRNRRSKAAYRDVLMRR